MIGMLLNVVQAGPKKLTKAYGFRNHSILINYDLHKTLGKLSGL